MAILYVSEYDELALSGQFGARVAAPQEPAIANQEIAVAAGNAQSAAFNARARFVRVHSDVVCHVAFGADPNATTVGQRKRLAAGVSEFFGVVPAQKVATAT